MTPSRNGIKTAVGPKLECPETPTPFERAASQTPKVYGDTHPAPLLAFSLPRLTPMMNRSGRGGGHWQARKEFNEIRDDARWLAHHLWMRRPALERAHLKLTRHSASEPDYDGLVAGMKAVVDGLVAAGVLTDDNLSVTGPWECHWEKAKPKQGKIRVEVYEVLP